NRPMRADVIRTARVPARLRNGPLLRQALERWLADGDLVRHGLPQGAIVVVRRLTARWAEVSAGDPALRYTALAGGLRDAGRPAKDDAAGEAVWFEDEAELLACLARDAVAATLGARWWWRLLLGGASPREMAIAHWIEAPRIVPRACRRLGAAPARAWIA